MTEPAVRTSNDSAPRRRIAILGTPSAPDVVWSAENLDALTQLGFTGVQVNIAWSYRPGGEPLNLEDVWEGGPVSGQFEKIAQRAADAKSAGLTTLFHFGAPFQGRAGFDAAELPFCISDDSVVAHYEEEVARFAEATPDLDDLLVYTYDQDAWLCSEFGGCPRCGGVPVHQRVSRFINAIARGWRRVRAQGTVWWEPWELSAGQALAAVPLLDRGVGIMAHSNIGEVVSTMPADRFVRNLADRCDAHAVPLIVEVFLSSSNEEVEPWTNLPVPIVTVEQLRAVEALRGVVGVKEYFGIRPLAADANLAAAAAYFADPGRDDDEILDVALRALELDLSDVREFWARASTAYRLFPWDASWFARQLGRSRVDHELSGAIVRGMQSGAADWDTPAWRSTRSATFMRTAPGEPHPWLLEDVGLRFDLAADVMADALAAAEAAHAAVDRRQAEVLSAQISEARGFLTRCRAYALHIRATNIARLLREPGLSAARRGPLEVELADVLARDLENLEAELHRLRSSSGAEAAPSSLQLAERWVVESAVSSEPLREAIRVLAADLPQFLDRYLREDVLVAGRGQFSLTSR